MIRALQVEVLKLKGATLPWWTIAVVCAAPGMTGAIGTADRNWFNNLAWGDHLQMGLANMATWYGVLLFGLMTSFLFGREYADGVAPNALTTPVRREFLVLAKMLVLAIWIAALAVMSVAAQGVWGLVSGLHGFGWEHVWPVVADSLRIAAVLYCTLPIVALVAIVSRGVFAPMIFSSFAFAAAMIGGVAGWGDWLPWAMPALIGGSFLGPVMPQLRTGLDAGQWAIALALFVVGMTALLVYVDHADVAN